MELYLGALHLGSSIHKNPFQSPCVASITIYYSVYMYRIQMDINYDALNSSQ